MIQEGAGRDTEAEDLVEWIRALPEVGSIERLVRLGRFSATYLVDTGRERFVAKRISGRRDPDRFVATLERLPDQGVPCPRPLHWRRAPGNWWCLFQHVDGRSLASDDPGDWIQPMCRLLGRIDDVGEVPAAWRVDWEWLELAGEHTPAGSAAGALHDRLGEAPPAGPSRLVHGDLAPQNVLRTDRDWMLLDWDQLGVAPRGFDAGWVLALGLVNPLLGPLRDRIRQAMIVRGVPATNLAWYEGLGLLRMHHRSCTLPLPAEQAMLVQARVEREIRAYLLRTG